MAPMGHAQGFDYSHWQNDVDPKDAGKKYDFVGIKAGQGIGYVDPAFASRRSSLRGELTDPSHPLAALLLYWWLDDSGSGTAQADKAHSTIGALKQGERIVLDLEDSTVAKGGEFVRRIHALYGSWPIVYTATWFMGSAKQADLAKCELWLADYSVPYTVPANWKKWTFLQYSATGSGLGIHPLDLDEFNGDYEALLAYSGFGEEAKNVGTANDFFSEVAKLGISSGEYAAIQSFQWGFQRGYRGLTRAGAEAKDKIAGDNTCTKGFDAGAKAKVRDDAQP